MISALYSSLQLAAQSLNLASIRISILTSRQEFEHELDVGQVATARLGAAEALAGGRVGAGYGIGVQHTGRHTRKHE